MAHLLIFGLTTSLFTSTWAVNEIFARANARPTLKASAAHKRGVAYNVVGDGPSMQAKQDKPMHARGRLARRAMKADGTVVAYDAIGDGSNKQAKQEKPMHARGQLARRAMNADGTVVAYDTIGDGSNMQAKQEKPLHGSGRLARRAMNADGAVFATRDARKTGVHIGTSMHPTVELASLVEQRTSEEASEPLNFAASKASMKVGPLPALDKCPSGKVCFFHTEETVDGSKKTTGAMQVEKLKDTTRVKFFSDDILDMESSVSLFIVKAKQNGSTPKFLAELPDNYAQQCGHQVILHAVLQQPAQPGHTTQQVDPDDPEDVTTSDTLAGGEEVTVHSGHNGDFDEEIKVNGSSVKESFHLAWTADQDLSEGSAFVVPVGTIVRDMPLAKTVNLLGDMAMNKDIDMSEICGTSTSLALMPNGDFRSRSANLDRTLTGKTPVEAAETVARSYAVGMAVIGWHIVCIWQIPDLFDLCSGFSVEAHNVIQGNENPGG